MLRREAQAHVGACVRVGPLAVLPGAVGGFLQVGNIGTLMPTICRVNIPLASYVVRQMWWNFVHDDGCSSHVQLSTATALYVMQMLTIEVVDGSACTCDIHADVSSFQLYNPAWWYAKR